ncbi:MAG: peptide chain release factor N(5)-glutamine methyltransferase [Chloroflexi bacterium]|nr:peptide chain release factor N(5)-glutamine methyltransferase [Chloroflexota bacterium]MCI0580108.1 peptide chain release factor N(5)-glutamine methyltransferase [Chloroflexota bacterium]MCI0649316.1 peptide chain release factor N(5)-glutamine methyltransferase [Chloroflexota bacterium]MCI0725951.1 peptide chain release factor N(5)-glutamine methyltransferase [Chloroflexota bacterium]
MTIQEALAFGRQQLTASPSPALDARLLLEHVLQVEHAYLVAHGDDPLTAAQEQDYRTLVDRAARRKPIPYLVGQAPFYGLAFAVSPAVLIPRPETELLLEAALGWARQRAAVYIVDVGTGSGCIAISLARQLPAARIEATDISPSALKMARRNAQTHGVAGRILFHHGELLEPVAGRPDLIVANLPYVTDHEWTELDDGVKWYEPDVALRGGPDGLDVIRQLLGQAQSRLAGGGAIFLEIGWQQGPAMDQLAQSHFPSARVTITPDYAGHDRIVGIETV